MGGNLSLIRALQKIFYLVKGLTVINAALHAVNARKSCVQEELPDALFVIQKYMLQYIKSSAVSNTIEIFGIKTVSKNHAKITSPIK